MQSQILQKLKRRQNSSKELNAIHAVMVKSNLTEDSLYMNQFITSAHNNTNYAFKLFSQMHNPNAFVYNAIIRSLVNSNFPHDALRCYITMLRSHVPPTSYTLSALFKGTRDARLLRVGETVHGHVWRNGFCGNVFVQTGLVDFYAAIGILRDARRVFDEMPERDVFAWNTMVSGYVRVGDVGSARAVFEEMGDRDRDAVSWNTMIDGYSRVGDVENAERLFRDMRCRDVVSWTTMIGCYSKNKRFREALVVFKEMAEEEGIMPDEVTMSSVVSACAHLGALDLGKEVHFYVAGNGFDLDVYIGSALVDMYSKCGSLERALLVFFKLREKNLYCWNAIIEGLAVHGYGREALSMFSGMEKEGIKPNAVTFISVLSACTHAGLVEEARSLFFSMSGKYSINPEVEHYGCMVDLLGKAGFLEDALDLIRSMRIEPNSVIWGALLNGCKLHKNLEIAQLAVDKLMVLEPDNSGYYTLLVNMYADQNRWAEVARVRTTMKEQGIEKNGPGSSWIEMEKKIHHFVASDESHLDFHQISSMLVELDAQLKLADYFPENESILIGCSLLLSR